MSDLLIVFHHVPQVITAAVMRLPDAHGVVGEVYIAIVAEELRHRRGDGARRG